MYRDASFTVSKPQRSDTGQQNKFGYQPPVTQGACKARYYLEMARGPVPRDIPPRLFVGEWMRALNVRTTDLAKRVGVSKAYISQLAHNHPGKAEGITRRNLYSIASAMGITVQMLLHPPPSQEELEHISRFDQSTLDRIRKALKDRESEPE